LLRTVKRGRGEGQGSQQETGDRNNRDREKRTRRQNARLGGAGRTAEQCLRQAGHQSRPG